VSDLQTLGALLLLAAVCAGYAWHRRRRTAALLGELGEGLRLAADAQLVNWRLERRYTDDLDVLARLRRDLAPFLDGSRHGHRTRWELRTANDGSTFDLAILAEPVRRGPFGRGRAFGYKHLLTAHGDRGRGAYDTFAEDERYLPRLRPARAA
jgi:hypothetical protein